MSTLAVTAEPLTIHPHPDADALELAQVGLYRAVVGKDYYQTGEYALYIPEQAVLPTGLIEELGLTGRLAGKAKDRVKAVRLRGKLSQGIVCRPAALDGIDLEAAHAEGVDFAELLGITKWVPPIPVGMAGKVGPAPGLMPWIDIENIKRYPTIFESGEQVEATEKIHGTCCMVTYDGDTNDLYVTSKGFGGKALSLIEDDSNLYWRAVRQYDLRTVGAVLCGYFYARRVGLFGEVYGKGVQDLHYGKDAAREDGIGYVLFDVSIMDDSGETRWLSRTEQDAPFGIQIGTGGPMVSVPRAPLVYRGPYDYEQLAVLAEGQSLLAPGTIREGLVVRPAVERRSDVVGGRAIAKFVGETYLTRKNGTEFE